jgi:PilZ domain
MCKDFRKAARTSIGSKVWIRLDDGFSVREGRLIDLSSGEIRILVKAPYDVAGLFSLLMTRDAAPGRRCRVKWRRGQEIGAEFVGANPGAGAR